LAKLGKDCGDADQKAATIKHRILFLETAGVSFS